MTKKKNTKNLKDKIEDLCSNEDTEICFQDCPKIKGEKVASFSFDDDNCEKESAPITKTYKKDFTFPRSEDTFKRCYKLTADTIRKVDELKAKHPDVTTYVSTIVELAITHYYDYIMNNE